MCNNALRSPKQPNLAPAESRAAAMVPMYTPLPDAYECPDNGDLHNETALKKLLVARSSKARELVILILGWTNGKTAINMREFGPDFVQAQLGSLASHGIRNTLVLTPNLITDTHRAGSTTNLCLSTLRPRGICCAYSSVGMKELVNNSWELFPTHPYLLYLQRWWFTAQALAHGVSILSLDTDLHLSSNPLSLVRAPPFDELDVIFQGDGAHPMLQERNNTSFAREAEAVGVDCSRMSEPHRGFPSRLGMRRSRDGMGDAEADRLLSCTCGVTAAPAINTGFVYARARHRRTGAGTGEAARLFNMTVHTILTRLSGPAIKDERGAVHTQRLWPQDVVNELVFREARLPRRAHALKALGHTLAMKCHPKDIDCMRWNQMKLANAAGVRMPKTWWVQEPRKSSVWLASAAAFNRSVAAGYCSLQARSDATHRHSSPNGHSGEPREASFEDTIHRDEHHLIAYTELAGGSRIGILPRTIVGRMCGRRKFPLSRALVDELSSQEPVPCTAFQRPKLLGMHVQHLQFMSLFTRTRAFGALHWWRPNASRGDWRVSPDPKSLPDERSFAAEQDPASPCGMSVQALAQRLPADERYAVLLATAVSNESILCTTPLFMPSISGLSRAPEPPVPRCPCCWRAPAHLSQSYTGCPGWTQWR